MTPEEAIMELELEGGLEITGRPRRLAKFLGALEVATEALKEIQQYREIGTVEECREDREKRKPMKVTDVHVDEYYCPACGAENMADQGVVGDRYCPWCGQAILWEENER